MTHRGIGVTTDGHFRNVLAQMKICLPYGCHFVKVKESFGLMRAIFSI